MRAQVMLDSDKCPFVAHLIHLFRSREWSLPAGRARFYTDPEVPVQWWLVSSGSAGSRRRSR